MKIETIFDKTEITSVKVVMLNGLDMHLFINFKLEFHLYQRNIFAQIWNWTSFQLNKVYEYKQAVCIATPSSSKNAFCSSCKFVTLTKSLYHIDEVGRKKVCTRSNGNKGNNAFDRFFYFNIFPCAWAMILFHKI